MPSLSSLIERRDGASVRDGLEAFVRGATSWPPLSDGPANPSFPVSFEEAEEDLARMAADPKPQARPLVLVGGWADPFSGMHPVEKRLAPCFVEPRIARIHHKIFNTHRAYRDRLVGHVEEAFPSEDTEQTTEVDVVAHSMGGLISRYAAMPVEGVKRLRLKRLFTMGTCHRGAAMAPLVQAEPLARDMLPGGAHLARLDAALPDAKYELTCYARLQDELVGTDRCAPEGFPLWWVPNRRFERAHWCSKYDARLLADAARRLRGEEPLTREPAAPLPGA